MNSGMNFLFFSRRPNLKLWNTIAIHPLAPKELLPNPNHDLTEVTLALEKEGEPEEGGAFERISSSVLHYQVFGSKIGRAVTNGGKVQEGDTIGLCYRFLPGLELFFASRVVEVFELQETEDGWRSGFVYQTLNHHPEVGEELFEVVKHKTGHVTFRLEAWSRPNLWFVRLFSFWARRIQKYAARCAVESLQGIGQSGEC